MKFSFIMILGWFVGSACGSADREQGIMLVDHYRVPCVGENLRLCLRASELDGSEYWYFYDYIEGFDYQWGHRYALRVEVTEIENPPQDGSSARYELIEVISDEVIDERFEIALTAPYANGDAATGSFSLLGQRDVTCAAAESCDLIAAALGANEAITLELGHPSTPTDPLIVYSTR
ncbi:MAG: DUF4377 domain-containing protein [Myxococcales bacterium]|nr:DUF4377 domain-containing protein [Myxococcales bacterium]